jgi:hypothetical protein
MSEPSSPVKAEFDGPVIREVGGTSQGPMMRIMMRGGDVRDVGRRPGTAEGRD